MFSLRFTTNSPLALVFLVLVLAGCAGPRYAGNPINNPDAISTDREVVIMRNDATRLSFRTAVENWLTKHHYQYQIAPAGSRYDPEKVTLEYEGLWGWDVALYLRKASIIAYQGGQRVGEITFQAANSLNLNKFGNAEERIGYMLEALFNKTSIAEANKRLKKKQ